MDREEKNIVLNEFHELVNMSEKDLRKWLSTDKSRSSSIHHGGSLSDHRAGQRVLEIIRKPKSELAEEDYDHMARAVGFIKRKMSEEPFGYLNESQWRFSLMNWGHDPLRNLN